MLYPFLIASCYHIQSFPTQWVRWSLNLDLAPISKNLGLQSVDSLMRRKARLRVWVIRLCTQCLPWVMQWKGALSSYPWLGHGSSLSLISVTHHSWDLSPFATSFLVSSNGHHTGCCPQRGIWWGQSGIDLRTLSKGGFSGYTSVQSWSTWISEKNNFKRGSWKAFGFKS